MEKTLVSQLENGYAGIAGVIFYFKTDDNILPFVRCCNIRSADVHGCHGVLFTHTTFALGRVSKQVLQRRWISILSLQFFGKDQHINQKDQALGTARTSKTMKLPLYSPKLLLFYFIGFILVKFFRIKLIS